MPNITTCPGCGALYEAGSDEQANEPDRRCRQCICPHKARIRELELDVYDWRTRAEKLEARADRLEAQISRAYGYLPVPPEHDMAFDGANLAPHAAAVADEWAIRERQMEALEAENARLREALLTIASSTTEAKTRDFALASLENTNGQ